MVRSFPVRKVLIYIIYILLFTTFQVSFPQFLTLFNQIADLMFVFVVLTGYLFGFKDGVVIGLITGAIRDVFSSVTIIGLDGNLAITFGVGMLLLFCAGAFGASFFTERMNRNIPFAFVSVASGTLIYKVLGHLISLFWTKSMLGQNYGLSFKEIIFNSILPQIFVNLIAAVPIILLLMFLGPYSREYRTKSKQKDTINYGDDKWLTI